METTCITCRKPRPDSSCGVCAGAVCRKCRIFLAEEEFPFVPERPEALRHTYYCGPCYDQNVAPFRDSYDSSLEAAKQVNVIYRDSKSAFRIVRKAKEPVRVKESLDRDATILRLAFEAARAGYNAIIEVEVSSRKTRNAGWQSSAWSGEGLPAEIFSHEMKSADD